MQVGWGSEPISITAKQEISALDNIVENCEFQDTPIVDILRLLARQNDLNLIIGPDSMGNVTLRFTGVSLKAALDAILRSKGYQYQIYDNIMLVARPDSLEKTRGLGLETRIFKLKYVDARDVKSVIDTARVLSPWGTTSIFSRSVAVEAAKAEILKPSTDPTAATEVKVADPIQRGQTSLQTRSDMLLVTDRPPNLEKVAKLLDAIDKPVKQVAIEVKFVESILGDDAKAGIDWAQLLAVQGSYQGRSQWTIGGKDALGAGAGTVQFGSLNTSSFNVLLDMLLRNQNSKLLSQPRVSSLDNQPAIIGVGVTTWIEERTGDPAAGTLAITYTERKVPIELVVVPHIVDNNRVMLELRPVVEEITGWQTGAQGQQLPLISSRTADTRIEVPDGQTAVIGGLLKDKVIKTTKKVWLLGSIPLIGRLFTHTEETVEHTDLSIFITPRIIKDQETTPFPLPVDSVDEIVKEEGYTPDTTSTPPTKKTSDVPKAAAKAVTLPDSTAATPPPETIDMTAYFPISLGSKWTYQWVEESGNRWLSNLTIVSSNNKTAQAIETIPEGAYKSQVKTIYRWGDAGLEHLAKVNPDKDSTAYVPSRIIIPARMEVGTVYDNGYSWTNYGIGGQKIGVGSTRQTQKLVKRDSVVLSNGKYKDCVVVETVWYDPSVKNAPKKRKLVWYAKDVGPVKVEHDTPLNGDKVKGKMSALLAKR